jgi:hypothetical protein
MQEHGLLSTARRSMFRFCKKADRGDLDPFDLFNRDRYFQRAFPSVFGSLN